MLANLTQSWRFCAEVRSFILSYKHPEIKGTEILEHCFLSTTWYTDDKIYFLRIIADLVKIFKTFRFSQNWDQIYRMWNNRNKKLKGAQLALFGMKWMSLSNETNKSLGTYFSYCNTIKQEFNFLQITLSELWQYWNLNLQEQIWLTWT